MTSSSSLGTSSVTIQFDLSRNIDGAARDVEAAINAARTYLPANLPANPTYSQSESADAHHDHGIDIRQIWAGQAL
jgi:multidrug efflux pump